MRLAVAIAASIGTLSALAQSSGEEMRHQLPEPAFDAAKAAFDALPETDRAAIQDALVWTGDYSSTADGTFGRRTFEAIQSWQRRAKRPAQGILDKPSVAALLANGARAKGAVGFGIVQDAASGARIGIPQRLLPKRTPNTIGGTRFQSADDRVTLDTRSQPGGPDDLRGLYERNLAIQTAGRQVTYRLQRPDFFVIAGETQGGRFYSRYAQEGSAIRGFSLGYDKALGPEFDRMTVAIANSFQPFGPAAPQAGVMAERPAGCPAPAGGPVPAGGSAAVPAASAVPSFTGLAVGARRVLAPASLQQACREPRIDGAPARMASTARDLTILEPAAPRRTVPLRYAGAAPEGAGVVAFFSASEGGRAVVTPAEFLAGGRIMAPLQEGAAGGVVLDRSGAIAGLVGSITVGRRAVAGLVPPAAYPVVAAATVREVAGEGQPAPGADTRSSAAAILPALVRIECGADRPAPTAQQPATRPAGQGIRLPPGGRP